MPKFRKKPVVIEARQLTRENAEELAKWSGGDAFDVLSIQGEPVASYVEIPTLEGTIIASLDDWIIKGVKGEFYPCKPEIFEATYEPVVDEEWSVVKPGEPRG